MAAQSIMHLSALIFSRDERAVRILKLLLDDLSIGSETFSDFGPAQTALYQQKYDGIFSECEDELGAELLKSVRRSKHNKRSIAFALSSGAIQVGFAFELGAHFVVQKPLVVEKVKRTLKAAHGLMMREQRIHYRHSASAHVTVKVENGAIFHAALRDLSQNGALIEAGTVMRRGQNLELRFILPDTATAIETRAKVTWSDPMGRAGVRFETLTEEAHQELVNWVVQRSEEGEAPVEEPMGVVPDVDEIEVNPDSEQNWHIEVEVIEPPVEEDNRLRATLRGQHHGPIKLLGFENGRPVVAEGVCLNISEKGLSAELSEEFLTEGPFLISLALPVTGHTVVLAAELRYHRDNRYGLEFLGLSGDVLTLVRHSVRQLPVE